MKNIIDISRELFSAFVYPGDPAPQKEPTANIGPDSPYNLTKITMGSHNGTHLDAPLHFIPEGKDVLHIPLEKCIGPCKVLAFEGPVSKADITSFLSDGTQKLLLKGAAEITPEVALVMADFKIDLIGVEKFTVGDTKTGVEIHRTLLGAEIIILEAINLENVEPGEYLLSAAPIKMAGLDGSPVRAYLMEF